MAMMTGYTAGSAKREVQQSTMELPSACCSLGVFCLRGGVPCAFAAHGSGGNHLCRRRHCQTWEGEYATCREFTQSLCLDADVLPRDCHHGFCGSRTFSSKPTLISPLHRWSRFFFVNLLVWSCEPSAGYALGLSLGDLVAVGAGLTWQPCRALREWRKGLRCRRFGGQKSSKRHCKNL